MRPFSPNHLYVQIREELAKRIATEVYPAGSVFPNEFVLASEMQVSVGTIRRAVEMLCEERLVIRSQGRGTVVCDRQAADYSSQFDRVRNADGSAIAWTFHEMSKESREATSEEIRALQLRSGSQIIALRRVREVNGTPVKREYVRLPFELFGDLEDVDTRETTIENLAFVNGIHIGSAEERLSLAPASELVSRDLRIPADTVVLRLERFVYDGANRPIEWRIAHCHLQGRIYNVPSPIGVRDGKQSPHGVLDSKANQRRAAPPSQRHAFAPEEN